MRSDAQLCLLEVVYVEVKVPCQFNLSMEILAPFTTNTPPRISFEETHTHRVINPVHVRLLLLNGLNAFFA